MANGNVRPGSIQTAAQEKFIQKFERAFYTLLHVFPMAPESHVAESQWTERQRRSSAHSALLSKTIAQSVKDQQYTLSREERLQERFRWRHKLVHYSVSALGRLSVEDFNIATLAITGLTKLVPKLANPELQ